MELFWFTLWLVYGVAGFCLLAWLGLLQPGGRRRRGDPNAKRPRRPVWSPPHGNLLLEEMGQGGILVISRTREAPITSQ